MIPFKINYHWYRARTVCCSKLHSTLKFRDVLAPGTHLGLVILHSPGPVDILVIPTILSGILALQLKHTDILRTEQLV